MPFKKDLFMVERCRNELQKFIEDMKKKRLENKVINNFLKDMSLDSSHSVQLDDLDKQLQNRKVFVNAKLSLVDDFVDSIKTDRALDQDYFNFFDLPEHVASLNYKRVDYEGTILKILQRVKFLWMAEKAAMTPEVPREQITITEHDLTPLILFD